MEFLLHLSIDEVCHYALQQAVVGDRSKWSLQDMVVNIMELADCIMREFRIGVDEVF